MGHSEVQMSGTVEIGCGLSIEAAFEASVSAYFLNTFCMSAHTNERDVIKPS